MDGSLKELPPKGRRKFKKEGEEEEKERKEKEREKKGEGIIMIKLMY